MNQIGLNPPGLRVLLVRHENNLCKSLGAESTKFLNVSVGNVFGNISVCNALCTKHARLSLELFVGC